MILFVETSDGNRKQYILHSVEDFDKIFDDYPQAHEIALSSTTIADAAKNIAEYLDSHHVTAWIESEDVMKSWKQKIGGILTAAALGVNSASIKLHDSEDKIDQQSVRMPMFEESGKGFEKEDKFLKATKHIESSNGKNTDHPEIKVGKFKGTRAIGQYAMLEPTIKETIKRSRIAKESLHPELSALEGMSRDQIESKFKSNPNIEKAVARRLARHVLRNHKGDMLGSSYSWLYGHNLKPSDLPQDYMSDSYVKKFHTHLNRSTSSVRKSEPNQSVSDWMKKRTEKSRSDTGIIDTQRKTKVNSDDIPLKDKDLNPRTTIKRAIDNAKKAIKKS